MTDELDRVRATYDTVAERYVAEIGLPVADVAELGRAIAPGGWLLCAFHVSSAEHAPGGVHHLDEWWGHAVDLDAHFLDPDDVEAGLAAAGFTRHARLERAPIAGAEYPSERAYLLMKRG